MQHSRATVASINLANLQANFKLAQQLNNNHCFAAVKANAYGHGLVECARALQQVGAGLAVAFIDEAIALRRANVSAPLLVLQGPHYASDVELAIQHGLQLVIEHPRQLQWVSDKSRTRDLPLWLKLDTGMHRLGFNQTQFAAALHALQQQNYQNVTLMTHFSSADADDIGTTNQQLESFDLVVGDSKLPQSVANSAAILRGVRSGHIARPGIMLYGISPFAADQVEMPELKSVMTLEAEVISLREIGKGESVGYGATWTATRPSLIATVAAGYADGYPRLAGQHGAHVWVRGQRAPISGTVSMDMMSIDVTDVAGIEIGDRVELWGKHISVNDVARRAGTIGYELVAALPARVPRHYHLV